MKNFATAERVVETAANSSGSALAENEKYLDSINGKIAQFQASWQSLSATMLSSNTFKGVVEGATGVLNVFDSIASKIGSIPTLIGAITTGIAAFRLSQGQRTGILDFVTNEDGRRSVRLFNRDLTQVRDTITGIYRDNYNALGGKGFFNKARAGFQTAGGLFGAAILGSSSQIREHKQLLDQYNKTKEIASRYKGHDASGTLSKEGEAATKRFNDAKQALAAYNTTLQASQTHWANYVKQVGVTNANFKGFVANLRETKQLGAAVSNQMKSFGLNLVSTFGSAFITAGISMAVSAVITGISKLITYQEDLRKKTAEASQVYGNTRQSIADYSSEINQLQASLLSGTLSVDESINARQRLIAIQSELQSAYGVEADGLNLVALNAEQTTDALNRLAEAQAQSFLVENKKGIKQADSEMSKSRKYSRAFDMPDSAELRKQLIDLANEFDSIDIFSESGLDSDTRITFKIDADVNTAIKELTDFKSQANAIGIDLNKIISSNMFGAQQSLGEYITETLGKYQEIQGKYGETDINTINAKIAKNKEYRDVQEQITQAQEHYNQALMSSYSSDAARHEAVSSALNEIDKIQNTIDNTSFSFGDDRVRNYLQDLYDTLKETAASEQLKLDIELDVDEGKTSDKFAKIKEIIKGLSNDGETTVKDILDAEIGNPSAWQALNTATAEYGVTLNQLLPLLAQSGLIVDKNSDLAYNASSKFSELSSSTTSIIEQQSLLNTALQEQAGSGILTLDTYSNLISSSHEFASMLELEAGSMKLNADAAQNLIDTKAKEQLLDIQEAKSDAIDRYRQNNEAIKELERSTRNLTDAEKQAREARLARLKEENIDIAGTVNKYNLLIAQLENATSAYSKWQAAQQTSNQDTMYKDMISARDQIKEGLKNGKIGTDDFKMAVKMLIPDAPDPSDYQAINSYMNKLDRYLTVDSNGEVTRTGMQNFLNDAVSTKLDGGPLMELKDGYYKILDGISPKDFVDRLKITPSMAQAIFENLETYGYEFDFVGDDFFNLQQIEDARKTVDDIKQKYKEIADNKDYTAEGFANAINQQAQESKTSIDGILASYKSAVEEMNQFQPGSDSFESAKANAEELLNILLQLPPEIKAALNLDDYKLKSILDPAWMEEGVTKTEKRLGQIKGLQDEISNGATKSVGLVKEFGDEFSKASDHVKRISKDLSDINESNDGFTGFSGKIEDRFSGISGKFEDGFTGLSGKIEDGVTKSIGKLIGDPDSFDEKVSSGFTGISGHIEQGFSGTYGKFEDGFTGISGKAISNAKKSIKDLDVAFTGISGKIEDGSSSIEHSFTGLSGKIEDNFSGSFGKIESNFSGFSGKISTGFEKSADGVSDGFTGIVGKFESGFSNTDDTITNGFTGLSGRIEEGISNLDKQLEDGFSGTSGKISSSISADVNVDVKPNTTIDQDGFSGISDKIESAAKSVGPVSASTDVTVKPKTTIDDDGFSGMSGKITKAADNVGPITAHPEVKINPKVTIDQDGFSGVSGKIDDAISNSGGTATKTISTTIDANTNPAIAKIEALANKTISIKVDANTSLAHSKITSLQETTPVNIMVTAETGIAQAQINSLQANPVMVNVSSNTVVAQAQIAALSAKINGTKHSVTVDYKPNTKSLPTRFSPLSRTVNYVANTRGLPSSLPSITRTVYYKKVGDGFSGKDGQFVNGTAHAIGSANQFGSALAGGNWGVKHGGTALVGELGPEIIVEPATGRWYTVGDFGAEFINIKPGSIVFNHKQTEALLAKGYVAGRASAFASGTALVPGVTGGGPAWTITGSNGSSTKSNKPSNNNNKNKIKVKPNNNNKSKGNNVIISTTADANVTVDVRLNDKDLEEKLKDELSKMSEEFEYLLNQYDHQIVLKQEHKSDYREIVATYQQIMDEIHAQAEKYRAKGLSDNSKTLIALQDQWLSYRDKMRDAIADYYEDLKKRAENRIKIYSSQFDYSRERDNLKGMQAQADLMILYNEKLKKIAHETAEYYRSIGLRDSDDEIAEMKQIWLDADDAIRKVKQDIVDYLIEIVDRASSAVDDLKSAFKSFETAAEEYAQTGGFITLDTFQELMTMGPQYMQLLKDENGLLVINRENVEKLMAARVRDLAAQAMLSYAQRIYNAAQKGAVEELNDLIYATGEATNATFGLAYATLAAAKISKKDYEAALFNMNAMYSAYTNTVEGLSVTMGSEAEKMADSMNNLIEYVMDMLEDRINEQIDHLNEMVDNYKEVVDLKKESLQVTKEENEYQKSLKNKLREIAKIQERLNALALDDSREAQAERKKLLEDLAEAQEDIETTQADKAYDVQTEALDKQYEAYKKEKDQEIELLEKSISSYQKKWDMA